VQNNAISVYVGQCVSACLSVCPYVRSRVSNMSKTRHPNYTKFSVHVARNRDLILLRRQCNMLSISGFVDDVVFSRNG